jgi:class 3 adenylate cyclase
VCVVLRAPWRELCASTLLLFACIDRSIRRPQNMTADAAPAHEGGGCWPWFKRVVLLDMFGADTPFQLFLRKLVLINGMVSAVIAFAFFVPRAVALARGTIPPSLWLFTTFAQAASICVTAVIPYAHALRTNEVPGWGIALHLSGNAVGAFGIAITNPSFPLVAPVAAYAIFAAICDVPMKYLYFAVNIIPVYSIGSYNTAAMLSGRRPLALDGYVEPTFQAVLTNCFAGAVLLAVPVAGCILQMRHHNQMLAAEKAALEVTKQLYVSRTRNTDCAPTEGRIAVLFTDIQDSTKLWGAVPLSMGAALDTHHAVIRECIEHHDGFEVKTAGDSFMIAVGDEARAMQLAVDIQRCFMKAAFPAAIDRVYAAQTDAEVDAVADDPADTGAASAAWNGPRVRIGVHSGTPSVVFDEVTKGFDYYGPEVNVAARIEAVARGGQICCTREFLDAQPIDGRTGYATKSLGTHHLKGVVEPTEVLEVTLPELHAVRVFAVPKHADVAGATSESDDGCGSAASGRTARHDGAPAAQHFAAFVATLFTAFRDAGEKEEVLGRILRAWRLERQHAPGLNFDAIARRVAGAGRRALRQEERDARMSRKASLASLCSHGSTHSLPGLWADDVSESPTHR